MLIVVGRARQPEKLPLSNKSGYQASMHHDEFQSLLP